jgi:hypothetical protein
MSTHFIPLVSALIHAEEGGSVRNMFFSPFLPLKFKNQIVTLGIQGFIQFLWEFA